MPYDEWGDWYDEVTPSEPENTNDETPETTGDNPTEPAPPSDGELEEATEQPLIIGDWNMNEADEYIRYHAIDNEDYLDADNDVKVKFLNVARRTLARKFKELVIPINADYLFAAVLASAFNDTNKLQQQGVAGFSVKGISFTFKDWAKKGLDALIPQEVLDLIGEENGVELRTGVRLRRGVVNGDYTTKTKRYGRTISRR